MFHVLFFILLGFGDIVPGVNEIKSGQTDKGARNLIIAIVYIFIGMANLVMCYDLMEEQLTSKFRVIAAKFGFSSEEDEDEDMSQTVKSRMPIRNTQVDDDYSREQRKEEDFDEEENEPVRIHVRSKNDKESFAVKSPTSISFSNNLDKKSASNFQKDITNVKSQSRETTFQFPTPLS